MFKKILVLLVIGLAALIDTSNVLANHIGAFEICTSPHCITDYSCQPSKSDPNTSLCQPPLGAFEICTSSNRCIDGYSCQTSKSDPKTSLCQEDALGGYFGTVKAPKELQPFINKGGSGAGGISFFLTNAVLLIYTISSVVFVFMLLWGAFDWITSAGDKEKVAAARNKIMYAIIGLLLFSAAVGFLAVIGSFTGFSFITGPNPPPPSRTLNFLLS